MHDIAIKAAHPDGEEKTGFVWVKAHTRNGREVRGHWRAKKGGAKPAASPSEDPRHKKPRAPRRVAAPKLTAEFAQKFKATRRFGKMAELVDGTDSAETLRAELEREFRPTDREIAVLSEYFDNPVEMGDRDEMLSEFLSKAKPKREPYRPENDIREMYSRVKNEYAAGFVPIHKIRAAVGIKRSLFDQALTGLVNSYDVEAIEGDPHDYTEEEKANALQLRGRTFFRMRWRNKGKRKDRK